MLDLWGHTLTFTENLCIAAYDDTLVVKDDVPFTGKSTWVQTTFWLNHMWKFSVPTILGTIDLVVLAICLPCFTIRLDLQSNEICLAHPPRIRFVFSRFQSLAPKRVWSLSHDQRR